MLRRVQRGLIHLGLVRVARALLARLAWAAWVVKSGLAGRLFAGEEEEGFKVAIQGVPNNLRA